LHSYRTTGLSPEQFALLCTWVHDAVDQWQKPGGRPRALRLAQAVKATVMYLRHNITQEVIAELLDTSQSTISRVIAELETVIAEVLDDYLPDPATEVAGRVVILDGSLCPCWSWADAPELYSGKRRTTGHLHEFISDLQGRLLYVSDPVPGNTNETKAADDTGILEFLDPNNTLSDGGYRGKHLVSPIRKPNRGELLPWHKEYNRSISKLRAAVERGIAHFKTWRTMHTDYRRPRHTYPQAFRAVRALHFFTTRFE
jgi:hypothetical protein